MQLVWGRLPIVVFFIRKYICTQAYWCYIYIYIYVYICVCVYSNIAIGTKRRPHAFHSNQTFLLSSFCNRKTKQTIFFGEPRFSPLVWNKIYQVSFTETNGTKLVWSAIGVEYEFLSDASTNRKTSSILCQ